MKYTLLSLAPQSVSKIVYDASRRAGIDPPVCSHRLRHALAETRDRYDHREEDSECEQVKSNPDWTFEAIAFRALEPLSYGCDAAYEGARGEADQ